MLNLNFNYINVKSCSEEYFVYFTYIDTIKYKRNFQINNIINTYKKDASPISHDKNE